MITDFSKYMERNGVVSDKLSMFDAETGLICRLVLFEDLKKTFNYQTVLRYLLTVSGKHKYAENNAFYTTWSCWNNSRDSVYWYIGTRDGKKLFSLQEIFDAGGFDKFLQQHPNIHQLLRTAYIEATIDTLPG